VGAFGARLPFLMKVLSARHALSLQAHPTREQAEHGFAAEERSGVPRPAPERTYRADWPTPEILVALEEFHALVGFRDPLRTAELFELLEPTPELAALLRPLVARDGEAALQEVFLDVLALAASASDLVDPILARALSHRDEPGELGDFARTALELDETFPRDPGILAALLMNRVVLSPGEALYIPAGLLHAHLRGTGIEVMASSDNVIRGGLTSKHIDVDELVRVVDFRWGVPEVLGGVQARPGVWDYPTHCREFDVWRLEVTPEAPVEMPAPGTARIALVTRGAACFEDGERTLCVHQGESLFVPATNPVVHVTGDAQVFVSSPGL